MKGTSREELIKTLADAGYSTNPAGIVLPFPVDFTIDGNLAYIDINAEAVRNGDEVPNRPVRVKYHLVSGSLQSPSVAELQPGDKTKALDRSPETPNFSLACEAGKHVDSRS